MPPEIVPASRGSNQTSASVVPTAGWSEYLKIPSVGDVGRSNSSGIQVEVHNVTSILG